MLIEYICIEIIELMRVFALYFINHPCEMYILSELFFSTVIDIIHSAILFDSTIDYLLYCMIAMNDSMLLLLMIVDCWWTCSDFWCDSYDFYEFEWESRIFHY